MVIFHNAEEIYLIVFVGAAPTKEECVLDHTNKKSCTVQKSGDQSRIFSAIDTLTGYCFTPR